MFTKPKDHRNHCILRSSSFVFYYSVNMEFLLSAYHHQLISPWFPVLPQFGLKPTTQRQQPAKGRPQHVSAIQCLVLLGLHVKGDQEAKFNSMSILNHIQAEDLLAYI
jgi:hypothetical protein